EVDVLRHQLEKSQLNFSPIQDKVLTDFIQKNTRNY
ncbi:MAG: hypothetical protein ACJAQ2_002497, partial [Vicingaceae bacterium]